MLRYSNGKIVKTILNKMSVHKHIHGHGLLPGQIRTQPHCFSVVYKEQGDPVKVLNGLESDDPYPSNTDSLSKCTAQPRNMGSEVTVKMLAAPINPADINMIQGVYPLKPSLPAVGGNEGVGEVVSVGENVEHLTIGDWVVPGSSGMGTWCTRKQCSASELNKVDNTVPLLTLATMGVTACTAYRMLVDFESLEPGDVVIQNAANSGVGQAVIQIAAYFGLRTINIVREREDLHQLVQHLHSLGASHVLTDGFVRGKELKEFMKTIPKAKLALNCVGGKTASDLFKCLDNGASVVTYGGMSKMPMLVPAGPLIFKDIKLRGYWMTEWNKTHSNEEKQIMWDSLCDIVRQGKLAPPIHREVPIKLFRDAVQRSMKPYTSEKQILVMHE